VDNPNGNGGKSPPNEMVKSTGTLPSAALVQVRNLEDLIKFSEFLAKSNLVPKQYMGKPNDIAVCILHGHEIGLSYMASLQSIAVINGNPGMYGDAPLALVRASGMLEWIKEGWEDATKTAICQIKRVNDPTIYEGSFSMKDAERIGLAARDSYKNYGRRMCQFRSRSFPLRDAFGDVLKGMRQAEEFEEFVETTAEHIASEPIMPKRASETAPKPDALDQRTPESEKPEEESQDPPADLTSVKAKVQQWVDGATDQEILQSSGADHLFELMKPIPDDDPDRSLLANSYMKRKSALWKKAKEANAQQ